MLVSYFHGKANAEVTCASE